MHYPEDNIYSPVTNGMTIKILLVLMSSSDLDMQEIDVQGAFLAGRLNDEEVYESTERTWKKFWQ
jgi:hypothetical protein